MPRNSLLTKEMIEEICRYVSNGLSNTDAIKMAGVGSSAFYQWIQDGKKEIESGKKSIKTELVENLAQARVKFKLFHLSNIAKAAPQDWRASAWALERAFPEEFSANRDMNPQDHEKVTQIKVQMVSNEQGKKRLKDMEKIVKEQLGMKEEDKNG